MADDHPITTSSVNFVNGKTPIRANTQPYTHRPLGRASTFADTSSSMTKRRGSALSDSFDDARQSIRSSTDDLLLPRPTSPNLISTDEYSHWHSAPLALALLPALGGIFFNNGGALVTDLTLLGLAAVFLNWSVKLPWEWYHSAQSSQPSCHSSVEVSSTDDAIIEEESENEDEKAKTSHEAEENLSTDCPKPNSEKSLSHSSAASELRLHEVFALLTCFFSPLIGAWLLHTIRSQLSRPSEGLVSNYNLTIFLLAAELRPLAHLARLIQARTLYLQRSLDPSPTETISPDLQKITDLCARLDDLEAHIAASALPPTHPPSNPSLSSTTTTPNQITTEVRKSLQPDLDALNRTVRRYEKRATLLSMHTESRLQDVESRMADAITLAAAAERSNARQRPKHGSFTLILLDWLCAAVVLPLQLVQLCVNLPMKIFRSLIATVERYVGRTRPSKQIRNGTTTTTMMSCGSGVENGSSSVNGIGNSERRNAGMKPRGMKKVY